MKSISQILKEIGKEIELKDCDVMIELKKDLRRIRRIKIK